MVAIYLVLIVIAFVAVSATVSNIVEDFQVTERTGEQLEDTVRLALETAQSMESAEELFAFLLSRAQTMGGRILYLDQNAVVQADTASLFNGYRYPCREVRDILVAGKPSSYGFHRIESIAEIQDNPLPFISSADWVVYYTAPVTREGSIVGVVLFASSIQDVVDSVAGVSDRIGVVFLICAVLVGVVTLFTSGWLTRPILTLTNAIRRVGAQGYSERVPVRGKDELSQLSEAFNIMSEKLENHERLRDEFVSNASHELKTPLSTMKILAETMLYQEEMDPAMAREFFEDINHEVDRLTRINNDMLRLVQDERAGGGGITVESIQLDVLTQSVIDRLMPLAKRKGVRLERKLLPVRLEGDSSKLDQVITNLIDNAIKYTDKGSVAVTVKPDGAHGVLSVHDTGIGIPKEAIPRLFERFYRVDKARSRSTGGTGLGLSIVERIVTMHHGYIQVESVPGRGSTFIVRLPLVQPQKEKEGGHEEK